MFFITVHRWNAANHRGSPHSKTITSAKTSLQCLPDKSLSVLDKVQTLTPQSVCAETWRWKLHIHNGLRSGSEYLSMFLILNSLQKTFKNMSPLHHGTISSFQNYTYDTWMLSFKWIWLHNQFTSVPVAEVGCLHLHKDPGLQLQASEGDL